MLPRPWGLTPTPPHPLQLGSDPSPALAGSDPNAIPFGRRSDSGATAACDLDEFDRYGDNPFDRAVLDERSVRAQASQTAAPAAQIDPSLFAGLRWRSIGPNRGGRSQAVAGRQPAAQYYFGATGGGLWKTTDGGITWRPVSDKPLKTSSVGAIAIAPSNPDVVYAGMGETELRGNVIQGDGVYKSTDAGKTWTPSASRRRRRSRASACIRPIPTSCSSRRSAIRTAPIRSAASSDRRTAARRGSACCSATTRPARSISRWIPKNPDVLYAGAVGSVPHAALAVERRAGQRPLQEHRRRHHWTEMTKTPGLPKPIWGKVGVSVSGADSNRALRHHRSEGRRHLHVRRCRRDAGSWSTTIAASASARSTTRASTPIPQAKDTFYVLNTGIYRSTDAGKTLQRASACRTATTTTCGSRRTTRSG